MAMEKQQQQEGKAKYTEEARARAKSRSVGLGPPDDVYVHEAGVVEGSIASGVGMSTGVGAAAEAGVVATMSQGSCKGCRALAAVSGCSGHRPWSKFRARRLPEETRVPRLNRGRTLSR